MLGVLDFAEREIGHRAGEDGLGAQAEGFEFGELAEDFAADELELGVCAELGDDVVVVGVEPLGHLAGKSRFMRAATMGAAFVAFAA